MKKMKKVLAMIVSLVMVLAMSLTAYASGEGTSTATKPSTADKKQAVVNKVEANATVTAYQIVKAKYNTNGFIGYERADGITEALLAKPVEPTSTEITTIGGNKELLASLAETQKVVMQAGVAAEDGTATFTADLAPGYWVVIVTDSDSQTIYNPMLVGVYYSVSGSDNTMTNDPVSATDSWNLNSTPVYAKSDKPEFSKIITGSIAEANNEDNTDSTLEGANNKGNDVAIGDTVQYKIEADIPSYSASYTNVTVKITDELSKGLVLSGVPEVTVNDEKITDPTNIYTYEAMIRKVDGEDGEKIDEEYGYTINFASAYALQHQGEKIVVTYNATLTGDVEKNFDPNTNTAKYIYSNDPQDENSTEELEEKTYTYTFDIDGKLTGKMEGEWEKVTEELLKGHKVDTSTMTGKWEKYAPLAGAEFKLTNNVTGKEYTTTSDGSGLMYFGGLDAGEYTLVETKAPTDYTINDTEVPVVITATYNTDGTLANYSIKVNNEHTSTYKATYNKEKVIEKLETEYKPSTEDPEGILSDAYIFWNTKLTNLPSTGGIGTTIFTIGGCIIMIIAAGLFFASRRKKSEN